MRRLAIALGLICLAGTSAFAADMAVKAPLPAAPVYDWSGLYIGGEAGWQQSSIELGTPGGDATYDPTHNSFAGGGFAGVQQQFGMFVLGIEGGYLAATGNESFTSYAPYSIFFCCGTGTAQAKLKDIWNVGARIGTPVGQWMPYITGGYANGAFQFNVPSGSPGEQANSSNDGGYLGAGLDYAVTKNWIVGAEYLHYFFSSRTVTSTGSSIDPGSSIEPVTFGPGVGTNTVLGRLSYKIDWMPH